MIYVAEIVLERKILMGAMSKAGAEQLSPAKLMWQMTRPHTLTATFVPITLGTVIALYETSINWMLFIALMVACLCLQIATNLFNEYYDFKRGLDTAESVGIGGGIVRHNLKPSNVLAVACILYALAAVIGVYICMSTSWWLVAIGVAGMAVGYFYTGGPLPIAYTPFGELFSGLFMGTAFILIATFIQNEDITLLSALISIPIGILVGAINMSNNIRDIEEDIVGGRKTLPILLGRERSIQVLASAFVLAYGLIFLYIVLDEISIWSLLILLSIPKPLKAIQSFKNGLNNPAVTGLAMKSTALTNTFFGALLAIGLGVALFLN
jgi:1,4-dihydroxy-2-naphthoate polyprenyltransferase